MKTLTRRLASVVLAGGVAIGSLSGCGMFGSALDCASIADSMNETAGNVSADEATFQESVTKLRDEATGIDDAELKTAVEDFANIAEELNKFQNDPTAVPEEAPDMAEVQALQDTFTEKCSAV